MKSFSTHFFFILFLLLSNSLFSQTQNRIGEFLKSKFENFEYEQVISSADSILRWSSNLTHQDSIQIFYFKAISYFNLWDINLSEENFRLLIKLDKNFELDSTEVSPKIIALFNQIKKKEDEIRKNKSLPDDESLVQSKSILQTSKSNFMIYKESIWKNLLLPGWGHLNLGEKTKGYFFISSFSISLISSISFSYLTAYREKEYLNEVIPEKIPEKYSAYNNVYKLRNFSLVTLGLIYLYSQLDFLLNSPSDFFSELYFNPTTNSFNFKIKFQF